MSQCELALSCGHLVMGTMWASIYMYTYIMSNISILYYLIYMYMYNICLVSKIVIPCTSTCTCCPWIDILGTVVWYSSCNGNIYTDFVLLSHCRCVPYLWAVFQWTFGWESSTFCLDAMRFVHHNSFIVYNYPYLSFPW